MGHAAGAVYDKPVALGPRQRGDSGNGECAAVAENTTYLVALVDSAASRQALQRAFALAGDQKGATIHLIHVVEVDRRLALDADLPEDATTGEQILTAAEEAARKAKIKARVRGDILQAREAGPAIVEEAVARGVDAIVLGVAKRGRESDPLALGRTAEYVLRSAPCEVVLVRQSAPNG